MPHSVPCVETISQVRAAVQAARAERQSIGFVPTMGALHEGHAQLIRTAARESGFVVVSIFVNPTQFGPNEDFTTYPRTLEADRALCAMAGAQLVFAPPASELYPRGQEITSVDVPTLTTRWEGPRRPGHFRGVATVVLKLFQIVAPDVAFFGEKDYQQLLVVRRMVADLNLPVHIVGVPTVREPDGLALSSRNRYLNPDQRRAATVLSRALNAARAAVAEGERSADRIRQILHATLESESQSEIDYADVADAETLEPVHVIDPARPARVLIAARVGPARLIDNCPLP